jgi:hypothetical protein
MVARGGSSRVEGSLRDIRLSFGLTGRIGKAVLRREDYRWQTCGT